jgi:SAM-dependent methyltransferase
MSGAYLDEQYKLNYPVNVDQHFWTIARSEILNKKIKKSAPEIRSWLEVGCGTGVVVKHLRSRGMNIDGCELASVPEHLWQVNDLQTSINAIDLEEIKRLKYDGILLLDVLEHIDDRVNFLKDLSNAFPNVKKIVVTVPARNELWSNYDTFYGHHLRYDVKTFINEFRPIKWQIKKLQYFFHLLYFVIYFSNLLFSYRNLEMTNVVSNKSKVLHKFVARLCIWDEVIFPKGFLGSSIFAIFEKYDCDEEDKSADVF